MATKSHDKWQYGDFQTPLDLARDVVQVIKTRHDIMPDVIIEPTCGQGAFLQACHEQLVNCEIFGFDINQEYICSAKRVLASYSNTDRVHVEQGDFFNIDWKRFLSNHTGDLLIIGNPPWVTSSELSLLNSKNHPNKSNFQNRRGIDAITGSSNFDISEWMLLEHLKWLMDRNGTIAFLCKISVARKIIRQIDDRYRQRFAADIYQIDAKAHFGASVEACLFVLSTNQKAADCRVYASVKATTPTQIIGKRDGIIVSHIEKYERWRGLRGEDVGYTWRTGIKHDCAKVMELTPLKDRFSNSLNEVFELEDSYIYPLLKSSDVANGNVTKPRRMAVVTQKAVGDDTSSIRDAAPLTWKYLANHKELLSRRKSAIYRNRPDYSIFGVGPYTFLPWKIAISGLYKNLNFRLVGPIQDKPIVFDDTVNFLPFRTEDEARFVYQLLTSEPATQFLESLIFWDEKRPITVKLLRQLSIRSIAMHLGKTEQYKYWASNQPPDESGQLRLGILETGIGYGKE